MKSVTLLVGSTILLNAVLWANSQGKADATNQVPEVSIQLLGLTNTGPPQTLPVTLSPVTNPTIFGPRPTFAGPTNMLLRTFGGTAALFQFSNASPQATYCLVQSLEYKTPTGWKTVSLPTSGTAALVPANSAITSVIPVTSTNLQWRVTAFCVEQATGISRIIERGMELGNKVVTGADTERFSGRKYVVTNSDSIKY